ncbi:MAG: hypothetical protein V4726_11065 [Verrucomicrobiota bacterium]
MPAKASATPPPVPPATPPAAEPADNAPVPDAVPVLPTATVDEIISVPDDLRGHHTQFVCSIAAVNTGLRNAAHALTALLAMAGSDEGTALLARRGINPVTVQRRLRHILSQPPDASADGH